MNELKSIIKQAIDLHLHVGPEIVPRKYNDIKSLVESQKEKIKGLVLKNHFYATTPLTVKNSTKGVDLYGSIVLNNPLGGINSEAIYAAGLLSSKPIIVWFPTIDAQNFLDQTKFQIQPEWVGKNTFIARESKLLNGIKISKSKELDKVLDLIKEKNYILATGHISPYETDILVNQALKKSIKKILITHPIYQKIDMDISKQISFAKKGCYIESCYSMYSIDKIPISKIAHQIKKIGQKNVVLSSDVGQTFSPSPSQALYNFAVLLLKEGVTKEMFYQMMVINPNTLLNN